MSSDKQVSFINSLLASREVPKQYKGLNTFTMSILEASEYIAILKECPMKGQTGSYEKAEPAALGFYKYEECVYQVVKSKTGNRYAKMLKVETGKGTWEYVKGMVNTLKACHLISLNEAKSFGHEFGFCMVCGRTLTDPVSVEAGIGPICANRFA